MNRRDLLAGSASLALAGAAPMASGASAAPEPLIALFARRGSLLALCRGKDDDEMDRICDTISDVERAMIETPATTPAGLNLKIRVLRDYCIGNTVPGCLDGDMLTSVLEDAERLARGAG